MKFIIQIAILVLLVGVDLTAQTAGASGNAPVQVAAPLLDASAAGAVSESPDPQMPQPNADIQVSFRIKYVSEGVVDLEGGRDAGLAEGVHLSVKDADSITGRPIVVSIDPVTGEQKPIATLYIFAVAESSAAAEIHDSTRALTPGDWAFLSPEDTAAIVTQRTLSPTRKRH